MIYIKISSSFKSSRSAVSCVSYSKNRVVTMFQTVNHDTFVKYNSFPIKIFFLSCEVCVAEQGICPSSLTLLLHNIHKISHHKSARCRSLSHVLLFVTFLWSEKYLNWPSLITARKALFLCVSSSIRLLTLSLVDIICTQTFAFPLVHLGL